MNKEPAMMPCPKGHTGNETYSTTKRCVECTAEDAKAAPWPIETRKQAAVAGRKKYYTGKPCTHGHVKQRYVASGICSGCNTMRSTAYQKNIRRELIAQSCGLVSLGDIRVHPDDVKAMRALADSLKQARVLTGGA